MTKFFKFSYAALITLLVIGAISSCKKDFDEPPSFQEPLITVTKTIAQIKALHVSGQIEAFTEDDVISGVVNADDQSGNYYKQISIQDETGGITIRLDATNLYANYPVGRKIYIKLKGLFMGDYNSLIQLGGAEDYSGTFPNVLGIPSAMLDTYIIKGSPGYTVPAKVVKISELDNSLQSMLIQIDSSEFAKADINKTYADAVGKLSANLNVEPCSGGKIIVRTSGFANFAAINVPDGNGPLRAIYTTFGSTKQLIIRDTSDVQFYNTERCDGSIVTPPPPPGPLTRISIAALRAMYTGTDITLGAYQIGGVVIATDAEKNLTKGNVILQDGTSGIAVYFGSSATLTYSVGDSVVIDITGTDLKKFSGSLEVDAFGMTPPAKKAGGSPITPVTKTLAQINTALALPLGDPGNVEYTLVKVVSVTAPAGTYGGNKTITDATGSTTLFTRNSTTAPATFAGSSFPSTCIDIVGYPLNFTSGTEMQIRTTADVTTGTGCTSTPPPPPPTGIFSENFESYTSSNTVPFAAAGWQNLSYPSTEDKSKFFVATFSSTKFLKVSSFTSTQVATSNITSWLITPAISLVGATTPKLSFTTAARYSTGTLKVLVSTDYNSANPPSSATWTDITAGATLPTLPSASFTPFIPSGNISLSAYNGQTVYIAYKYEVPAGTAPSAIATFEIDDVLVAN
ncbi:MAG: DUF5689 domain-containing protein [Bacteroidota bacterium]